MKIGIVGHGVVGDALCETLTKAGVECVAYDPGKLPNNPWEPIEQTDMVCLCVPTPTDFTTGAQDLSILAATLIRLHNYKSIVIIKSTVLPSNLLRLAQLNAHLRIVAWPEFLTADHARLDMEFAKFHIVGSDDLHARRQVTEMIRGVWPCTIHETSLMAAMMVKYAINSSLALRVAHMNELCRLWETIRNDDTEWNDVVRFIREDRRMGMTHMWVPGPDGQLGFGGACLPKDVLALITLGDSLYMRMHTLDGAMQTNTEVRADAVRLSE